MICFFRVFVCFLILLGSTCAAKKNSSRYFSSNRYASIVVDGQTGDVLYARNADAIRHPASLVKKMTLYLIFEALQKGKISLKTELPVSQHATNQIPCKLGLKRGQYITVEDIIKGLVTKSANDAAVVIAEAFAVSEKRFTEVMNKKAIELGMYNTRFFNASGVPHSQQITTASDMVILARALYDDYPQFCHYLKIQNFHFKGARHANHNRLLGKVHGVVGIKTGFVNASGFNISTASERNGRRIFVVVLGGSTGRSRDQHTKELIEIGFRKVLGSTSSGKALVKNLAMRTLEKELVEADEEPSSDGDNIKKHIRCVESSSCEKPLRPKDEHRRTRNTMPSKIILNPRCATPISHNTSVNSQRRHQDSCVNWVMPEETRHALDAAKECKKTVKPREIKAVRKNNKRKNKLKKRIPQ